MFLSWFGRNENMIQVQHLWFYILYIANICSPFYIAYGGAIGFDIFFRMTSSKMSWWKFSTHLYVSSRAAAIASSFRSVELSRSRVELLRFFYLRKREKLFFWILKTYHITDPLWASFERLRSPNVDCSRAMILLRQPTNFYAMF